MAKGRRPDNGKRPQGKRPSGRPQNPNARPQQGRPSASPSSANIKKRPATSKQAPSSDNIRQKAKRPGPSGPRSEINKPSDLRSRKNYDVENGTRVNVRPSSGVSAQDPRIAGRPLFGDEQIVPAGPVVEKEKMKAPPKKLSWWQIFLVRKKNKAEQKSKQKEEEAALRREAEKAEEKVPDVFDEMRPDVGEERRKHMAKTRKRETLRVAFNAFLSLLILTGLMIIAVLYVVDYVAAKPAYAFAAEGSIEHTIGATALVARNETVMTSTHTGELMTQATEGSRVAKGQLLAMVIPEGMESTLEDLQNVEQQIVDIERQLMMQGKGVAAKAVFSEANEEISPIITMIRQDAILNKLNNMTSYSSSIRVLMEKRDSNLKDIDFEDEQLTSLRGSESALKSQLESRANSIFADAPGIVSFKLDGLENEVNYDLLMSMVDSRCDELINQSNSIITGDLDVKQNEPVLRIVQNDVQYFGCILKGASMEEFQLGSSHVIRIPAEGISISDCKVIRCTITSDGLLVVFETTNSVERLLDRRTVNIQIVQTKTTGIRVPVSSLANADYDRMIATIFVNESGYARGYTVQIKDYDREYAIIAPLEKENIPSISTIVITNPQTVKEGDKVEK
ncbi:MAG: hypothetical protein IJL60_05285 [Clostridiales bacterium]|nr:hypothetical protein [Clostridiales bacterium]